MINTDTIISDIIESLEWNYQNGHFSDEHSTIEYAEQELLESIDRQLVYRSDIMESWKEYGFPEPGDMPFSDFDSIESAISHAVYESLRDDVNIYDVVVAWLQTHASLFEGTDVDPSEDWENAVLFLADYRDGE